MKLLQKIIISGLTAKSGEAFNICVNAPSFEGDTYSCQLLIPGIADLPIYSENALSALISALRVAEAQIYGPSEALIAATTLTSDDYPEVTLLLSG